MTVCYLIDRESRSASENIKSRAREEEPEANIGFNESEDWL